MRKEVNILARLFPTEERYVLFDRLQRAILSVILQIAEGSNRKTEKDKNLFLNRSMTSLDEVVACFDCALDDNYITQDEYKGIMGKIENVSRQLRGFEKFIRNSY